MNVKGLTEGDVAWIGLTAYVMTYDVTALATGHETLSKSFCKALDHPVRRWPTIAVWAYLTAHLFRLIPARWDPLRRWFITEQ